MAIIRMDTVNIRRLQYASAIFPGISRLYAHNTFPAFQQCKRNLAEKRGSNLTSARHHILSSIGSLYCIHKNIKTQKSHKQAVIKQKDVDSCFFHFSDCGMRHIQHQCL